MRTCLFSETEIDIKGPLRAGASTEKLTDIVRRAVKEKPQRHDLINNRGEVAGRAMYAIGG